jgi:hypothetical protein
MYLHIKLQSGGSHVKKTAFLIPLLSILVLASISAQAQKILTGPSPSNTPNQNVLASLGSLPDADALLYFNPQRILKEAAPRLMAEKDLAELRKGFEEIKKNVGVDPTKVEYLVIATRFRKPAADLSFVPPEFLVVAGGDFSADSLLSLAKLAAGDKLRDEKHGNKTLGIMTIDPILKEAEKNPILRAYSEIGIVGLNQTTIAVGSIPYLKAAVDASEGTGRITTENLNSLLRDPTVLISAAGSPWSSFSKSFGLRGTEANARAPRCDSQLGDFYASVTMDSTNFLLRGSMNADNPDTAKIFTNLISGLIRQASSMADPSAQSALKSVSITAEENDVVVRADIKQQVVIDFIKKQSMQKKAEPAAEKTTTPVKRQPVRRKRKRA